MQTLELKVGLIKENARLMTCFYKWLMADEAYSNTARFGDLTPAIKAQRVKRRIRVASPRQASFHLDEGVQQLSLNAAEGQSKTFSKDDLWKTFGPQTLRPMSL